MNVIDLRRGAILGQKRGCPTRIHQFGYLGIRIIQIAENARVEWAAGDAHGILPLACAFFTEGALLNNALLANLNVLVSVVEFGIANGLFQLKTRTL